VVHSCSSGILDRENLCRLILSISITFRIFSGYTTNGSLLRLGTHVLTLIVVIANSGRGFTPNYSGDGTLSVMDTRSKKAVPVAHSEDQEDELLSIVAIKGFVPFPPLERSGLRRHYACVGVSLERKEFGVMWVWLHVPLPPSFP
jgi:hypothetical protein